jgi:hypothetical protein
MPTAVLQPNISIPSVGPNANGSAGVVSDWTTAKNYLASTPSAPVMVRDATVDRMFRCLVAHTSAATPPSEDTTNWYGLDYSEIGTVRPQGHKTDDKGWLVMTAGRTVSRTKHKRLMDKIAPVKTGIALTTASSTITVPPGVEAELSVGDVVEATGVPLGAMVGSISAVGSKVGTVGITANTNDKMFFNVGVLAAGYAITPPSEVVGTGLGANATIMSVQADIAASASTVMATVAGTTLIGASSIAGLDTAKPGCYITGGANIAANTRLVTFDKRVVTSGAAGTRTGSNKIYFGADHASSANAFDPTMLVGRQFAVTGLVTNSAITAVDSAEAALLGNWSYVTGATGGLMGPWDSIGATDALLVASRRFIVDGISAGSENYLVTVNGKEVRNGSLTSGQSKLWWRTGEAALAGGVTAERRLGRASGTALANTAYVASHVLEATGVAVGVISGSTRVFYPTGATQGATANFGEVGQHVTPAVGGITQARVTQVQAEFTSTNAATANSSTALCVQPGIAPVQLAVGQKVSGGNLTAGSTIAAVGTDYAIPKATWNTGNAGALNLPVGANLTAFVVNKRFTGTGIPAANGITIVGNEPTDSNTGSLAGSATLFLRVGAGTAAHTVGRYFTLTGAGFAADSRFAAGVTAQSTQANCAVGSGSPNIYMPAGQAVPAGAAAGAYVSTSGASTFANARVISQTGTATFTGSYAANGTVIYLPVGAYSATSMLTSRGVSGAGIPSFTSISSSAAETAIAALTTTNGSTTVNAGSAVFSAASVGMYISGPGIVANTRISAFISATQVTIGAAAGAGFGTGAGTLGGTITPTGTLGASAQTNITLTLAAYVTCNTNNGGGTQLNQTLTMGPNVLASSNATSTIDAATNALTLGAIMALSASVTANSSDATDGKLGALHTLSTATAATGAAANVTATFGRWLDTDASVGSTVSNAATTMVAGAVSTLDAPATANDANAAYTFGTHCPAGITSWGTNRSLVAARVGTIVSTSSTNAASNNNAAAVTLGPIGTVSAATTAGTPQIAVGGYAVLDAINTAVALDATYSFGSGIVMARAIIPGCTYTNNNQDGAKGGAAATTINCYDTSNVVVGQAISGPNIQAGATVSSITNATQFVISLAVTGAQADVMLIQPVNATVTNGNASVRFFPYGQGDGATTFSIGVDSSGRSLTIGGSQLPMGGKIGSANHTLLNPQMPAHNHHNVRGSFGVVANGEFGFTRRSSGASDTSDVAAISAGNPDIYTSQRAPYDEGAGNPFPKWQPSIAAAKALAIYAGAGA